VENAGLREPRRAVVAPARWTTIWFAVAIALLAANLRPAVVGMSPLLPDVQAGAGLSGSGAGVLSALPVLCFGLVAPLAPVLARRVGIERALLVALVVLCCGFAVRSAGPPVALFAGAVVVGSAIAIGNVLLPSLVKRDFAARTGLMTGLYTMALAGGAALAAGLTVPLARAFGLDWRGALAMWVVFALLALVCWLPQVRRSVRPPRSAAARPGGLLRDPLAWQVTVYMGLQSLGFFAVTAWLPALLLSRGFDATVAGWMLSLVSGAGIVGATAAPVLAARTRRQGGVVLVSAGLAAVGLLGLLALPGAGAGWVAVLVALLGIGQNAALGIALTLVGLRAPDAGRAAELSGMAQSAGYVLAAAGPFAMGLLHDLTAGWTAPLLMLLALLVVQAVAGVLAGRDRLVSTGRPG
jgi:CP family cyanate transporter-like MFS transporter